MNKSTGKPKGTAFVEFLGVEGATAACRSCALQREGKGEGVRLRGKQVAVDAAVVQDKARALAVQLGRAGGMSANTGHKRNVHLVRDVNLFVPFFQCYLLLGVL
jgi:nucleolar protein 4